MVQNDDRRKARTGSGRRRIALAGALLLGACSKPPSPDVLLVVVDTLRADRMSCYGYFRPTTPFIDTLAAEGALFEDVTAQFSWTVPSMVSMFTGHYLTDLTEEVGSGQTTLAQAFQRAGYLTLGASANLLLQEDTGLLAGFDYFDAMPEDVEGDRSLTELGKSVLQALDERANQPRVPVFLYLHAFEPHDPYRKLASVEEELPTTGAAPIQPEGWMLDQLRPHEALAPEDDPLWRSDRDWIRRARGRYDHEIRSVDEQLQAFTEILRERGLLDNAIIALVSDHGEGLWEHAPPDWLRQQAIDNEEFHERLPREVLYQKHGAIQFQEVLATPMLIWGTGVPSGLRIDSPVENIDLFPTLLELADIPLPDQLHGTSLAPHLNRKRVSPRAHVFSLGVQAATVRESATGLKLVIPQRKSALKGEPIQLFALFEDPHERVNLAASRPGDVVRLQEVFTDWKADHPTTRNSRGGSRAAERTAAQRRRLSVLGYSGAETTDEDE